MTAPVAFYAPLKPPDHPVPSGDRRMARALMRALTIGGHPVELASRLRSYDRTGDPVRQRRIKGLGGRVADQLLRGYRRASAARRPRAWLTYHAYHKSPDWLGPRITAALGIPYLLAETSFAPKQQEGPWAAGHAATVQAIRSADVVLAVTEVDAQCLAPLVVPPAELRPLRPFIDPAPYRAASAERSRHRGALVRRFDLDPQRPWLLAVAMMRDDVKRESYGLLAHALAQVRALPWQLLVVGDGPARAAVEAMLRNLGEDRVRFAGLIPEDALAPVYAAADLYVWPAVREAYGIALLEAQAAGLPVVAGRDGGVAEVVADGQGGILTPPRDPSAFAHAVQDLLERPERRHAMAEAAARFVGAERSIERAAAELSAALAAADAIRAMRR
jgi:glycosyltransferase involved in cell wall biosynthesis